MYTASEYMGESVVAYDSSANGLPPKVGVTSANSELVLYILPYHIASLKPRTLSAGTPVPFHWLPLPR